MSVERVGAVYEANALICHIGNVRIVSWRMVAQASERMSWITDVQEYRQGTAGQVVDMMHSCCRGAHRGPLLPVAMESPSDT